MFNFDDLTKITHFDFVSICIAIPVSLRGGLISVLLATYAQCVKTGGQVDKNFLAISLGQLFLAFLQFLVVLEKLPL